MRWLHMFILDFPDLYGDCLDCLKNITIAIRFGIKNIFSGHCVLFISQTLHNLQANAWPHLNSQGKFYVAQFLTSEQNDGICNYFFLNSIYSRTSNTINKHQNVYLKMCFFCIPIFFYIKTLVLKYVPTYLPFICTTLNIIGSFYVKKPNTLQTFYWISFLQNQPIKKDPITLKVVCIK